MPQICSRQLSTARNLAKVGCTFLGQTEVKSSHSPTSGQGGGTIQYWAFTDIILGSSYKAANLLAQLPMSRNS